MNTLSQSTLHNSDKKAIQKIYNHRNYQWRRKLLRFLLEKVGFPLFAKYDHAEGIENVPSEGPALIMINHIAFIDPLAVVISLKRNIVPLAKKEVYDYPVIGIFPKIWGVVPVSRGEVDRKAIRKVIEILQAGEIVLVAPEGTRGSQLRPAKEGIAYLGSRSGVPVIPTAIEGTEPFPALRFNSAWKTSGALIRFGRPFKFQSIYERASREELHKMTNEAMYILAGMLPEHRRGYYSNLSKATSDTIEWIDV
jgi:1-acyl-sn-glycerol-3-phosphate acyltransferase